MFQNLQRHLYHNHRKTRLTFQSHILKYIDMVLKFLLFRHILVNMVISGRRLQNLKAPINVIIGTDGRVKGHFMYAEAVVGQRFLLMALLRLLRNLVLTEFTLMAP